MVSRETLTARGLAHLGLPQASDPDAVGRLVALTQFLEAEAIPRGFMGAAESDRILTRHVLESAALNGFLPPLGRLVDVGSGAGLPGLVLACLRTDPVVLLEPMAKRAAFLREALHRLEVDAEIVQQRAEQAARDAMREGAHIVTARALAPLPHALELLLPLTEVGGLAALLVGASDAAGCSPGAQGQADPPGLSTAWASRRSPAPAPADAAARALGGGRLTGSRFEVPGAGEPRWVMIVHKLRLTPDLYPRPPQARRRRPFGGDVA